MREQEQQTSFIEIPVLIQVEPEVEISCKSVKSKCCKKYKKKGRHCKKCPKLLLINTDINFSSKKVDPVA